MSAGRKRELARAALAALAAAFPAVFDLNGARRPLKVGIRLDVAAAWPTSSTTAIRRALSYYCGSRAYLRTLVTGAARIDLAGQAVGVVTSSEAADARERITELQAQAATRQAAAWAAAWERRRQWRERQRQRQAVELPASGAPPAVAVISTSRLRASLADLRAAGALRKRQA